jgi:hypothetical protein
MSTPAVIRQLSSYLFTSSARIATLRRDANEMNGPAQAQGSVNVFITDFGVVLEMMANRLQQTYASGDLLPVQVANVLIYDPDYVSCSFLQGYRVEPLAKNGLYDKRQMSVDWTVVVGTETAHAVIADVNGAVPVTT